MVASKINSFNIYPISTIPLSRFQRELNSIMKRFKKGQIKKLTVTKNGKNYIIARSPDFLVIKQTIGILCVMIEFWPH